MKRVWMVAALLALLCTLTVSAFAAAEESSGTTAIAVEMQEEEETKENVTVRKAWTAAILMGVACLGGALGMAATISKALRNIAEQPEAAGSIRTSMMMGLVFIETVIIYALIVAILIIFVL